MPSNDRRQNRPARGQPRSKEPTRADLLNRPADGDGIPKPALTTSGGSNLKVAIRRAVTRPKGGDMMATPREFEDLTDKRQKVVKALAATEDAFVGRSRYDDGEFARSQVNAVFYKSDLSEVIDEDDDTDTATLQVTTDLLNKIEEEDGWFTKTQQGGDAAFVIDAGASEAADERVTGVTPDQLSTMAHQVLERHGIEADLSHVNFGDWNEVIDEVNSLVRSRVLMIKSEPNLYELTSESRSELEDHV